MVGKHGSLFQLILRHLAPRYIEAADYKSSAKAVTHTDRVSPVIVLITSSTAALLPFLSFDRLVGGGGTKQGESPATISGGLPSNTAYQGFVVSIMFAFSCAFSAMFLYRKPQAARVFRFSAIMWFASAFLLLIFAVFCNRLS